jgi:hypothetical protein
MRNRNGLNQTYWETKDRSSIIDKYWKFCDESDTPENRRTFYWTFPLQDRDKISDIIESHYNMLNR